MIPNECNTADDTSDEELKKCPYCAENIRMEAIKCRYCGEFLDGRNDRKWYFSSSLLVIGLLCVGPFALPLLWFNPKYSRLTKIIWSAIILVISYGLYVWVQNAMAVLQEYYNVI